MRFSYLFKTCRDHYKRARLSHILSVFTIMFLLSLVGLFGLIWLNLNGLLHSLSDQVRIHAYLTNGLDEQRLAAVRARVEKVNGILRVDYISKEAAAAEFQKEFGKELFDALQENPLPASLVIQVKELYRTEGGIQSITERIQAEAGVDEVVSHYKTFRLLNRYATAASRINLLLFLFVAGGSLLLVANNIRLVISSQHGTFETMRLVGATPGFIRTPLLLQGLWQGVVGGVLAWLILQTMLSLVVEMVGGFNLLGREYGYVLVLAGGILGVLGSWIGIKRYLREPRVSG